MTETTLLFHISDIHFGLEDDRALDWVMQEIAEKRPAAVAITGDLTMRARHREFDAACRWISALDVPVTVEVGNHDLPYFNLIERFTDPYRRFRSIERVLEREYPTRGGEPCHELRARGPLAHVVIRTRIERRDLLAL